LKATEEKEKRLVPKRVTQPTLLGTNLLSSEMRLPSQPLLAGDVPGREIRLLANRTLVISAHATGPRRGISL